MGFYSDYTMNCSGSSFVKDSGQCRSPGDDWTASGPGIGPGVATTSPESGTIWNAPLSIMQATWTSPISNRLLFESGYSEFRVRWGDVMPEGAITNLIPVTEQSTNAGVPFANYLYRGWLAQPSQNQKHLTWRASLSYVSGSNNLKFGYQGGFMVAKTTTQVAQQLSYTFNNGAPIQLSTRVGPTRVSDRLRYDAFYVQDAWTRGRLTLQGALRFETGLELEPGRRERRPRGAPVRKREHLSPHRRREGLPGPHAARRRRVRPVRQRQDRRQDELRTVPAGRVLRRGLHDQEPGDDARLEHQPPVDRSERRSDRAMRLPEPARPTSSAGRGRT